MFEKMFFVTPHTIKRFRERVYNSHPSIAIKIILKTMQGSYVIKKTWRNGLIYHCHAEGQDFFPIVCPPATPKGDWPVITTIITIDTQEGRELKRRAEKLCLIK